MSLPAAVTGGSLGSIAEEDSAITTPPQNARPKSRLATVGIGHLSSAMATSSLTPPSAEPASSKILPDLVEVQQIFVSTGGRAVEQEPVSVTRVRQM